MTVKELMEKLQHEDPDRIIVMAKDSEGNNYTPLCDYWVGAYRPETTYYGDVGAESIDDFTQEDLDAGWGEADVISDGQPALILKPTW